MLPNGKNYSWPGLLLGCLVILAVIVSACSGSATSSNGSVAAPAHSSMQQHNSSTAVAQQYLIKSLSVGMEVKDTRQVAADLQAWISTTDPSSTSAGTDYEQAGDNLYTVSMTFSVQATLYPKIYRYLRDYNAQHGGRQASFTETVQDVTNDYVDTQSRLKNLRGEQQRLLTLLGQAQALNDVLSIEQRLTDVEGQIEQIEAHLNTLKGQVSFYNVTISLQPSQASGSGSWNPGKTWQDALGAAGTFGQGLASFFIWLLVFSVYLIPIVALIWAVRWWRRRLRFQKVVPKAAMFMAPPVATASGVPPQEDA